MSSKSFLEGSRTFLFTAATAVAVAATAFGSTRSEAKPPINMSFQEVVNLSQVREKSLTLVVSYPALNQREVCGLTMTSWDAAPEFSDLANALEITTTKGDPVDLSVRTEEPQGAIDIDLSKFKGGYQARLLLRSKTNETIRQIAKRLFRKSQLIIAAVRCSDEATAEEIN